MEHTFRLHQQSHFPIYIRLEKVLGSRQLSIDRVMVMDMLHISFQLNLASRMVDSYCILQYPNIGCLGMLACILDFNDQEYTEWM